MKYSVIVHPNAKNPRIEKDMLENLHLYVSQPPLDGKANKAVIKALAKHFGVRKNRIILVSGAKSKNKTFEVLQ